MDINVIIEAFTRENKFKVNYEEDLEDVLEKSETYAYMCDRSKTQKINTIPIILNVMPNHYSKKEKERNSYSEEIELLRTWFNSIENKTRLLREWKGMRFTVAMQGALDASEITVYRAFVTKLMSIQNLLTPNYQRYSL